MLTMTNREVYFRVQWCQTCTIVGFGCLLFLLLLQTPIVGSREESGSPRETPPRSSEEQPLLQHSFTTASPVPLQIPSDSKMTQLNVRRKRSSASAATKDTVLPSNILTTSHLSALRDLVSEKKISVYLGLRVSLTGPKELLDPQLLLSLNKEAGIYNIGGKAGLFSMRILEIKKVTSAP